VLNPSDELRILLGSSPLESPLLGNDLVDRVSKALDRVNEQVQSGLSPAQNQDIWQLMSEVQFRRVVGSDVDLRGIFSARHQIISKLLRLFGPDVPPTEYEFGEKGDVPRVGFIAKHWNETPETWVLRNAILDCQVGISGASLVLFLPRGVTVPSHDPIWRFGLDLKITTYEQQSLITSVNTIRNESLDFLYYGSDVVCKLSALALFTCFRLARRACIDVCTIASTGSPYVDYHATGGIYLDTITLRDFTEDPLRLAGLGWGFVPASPYSDQLQKNKGGAIFASLANYHKFTPEYVDLLRSILKISPRLTLKIAPFPPHYGVADKEAIAKNIISKFSTFSHQVKIYDSLGSGLPEFLHDCKFVMDSIPYSGLTSVFDSLCSNVPVFTLKGRCLRNCHAAGLLIRLGLDDFVYETKEALMAAIEQLLVSDPYVWNMSVLSEQFKNGLLGHSIASEFENMI
jgi:hypothetical protein